jgi:hypothetical protein
MEMQAYLADLQMEPKLVLNMRLDQHSMNKPAFTNMALTISIRVWFFPFHNPIGLRGIGRRSLMDYTMAQKVK